jgi:hypothetical protein
MLDEIKMNDKEEKQVNGFWVLFFFAAFLVAIIILGAIV